MKSMILITGATTLIGAEIVRELLVRPDVGSLLITMPAEEALQRLQLNRLEAYLGRMPNSIVPIAADSKESRFGLSQSEWQKVVSSIDAGFHCEQRETPDQNLALARASNVRPLENWLELLETNPNLHLHHLSTAFVAGTRHGLFTEFDLDCGQNFHNAYERSKFEAEVLVRQSSFSGRINIYRPSHTLGRAATGEAIELGGAYPLLSMMTKSRILPGDPRASIDLVPVDYVAQAMASLANARAAGTFHLAAGWARSLTIRQVADIAAKASGRSRGPRIIPRGLAWPFRWVGSSSSGGITRSLGFTMARDLLHQGAVFDTYLADMNLRPIGIAPSQPESWLEHTLSRRWDQKSRSDGTNDFKDRREKAMAAG
jgi:thioester reductase-like protein